jgi:hypothetical protein
LSKQGGFRGSPWNDSQRRQQRVCQLHRLWILPGRCPGGRRADAALHCRCRPAVSGDQQELRRGSQTRRGSMFRVYRDPRFSKEKSPFKPAAGAQFPHPVTSQDIAICKSHSASTLLIHVSTSRGFLPDCPTGTSRMDSSAHAGSRRRTILNESTLSRRMSSSAAIRIIGACLEVGRTRAGDYARLRCTARNPYQLNLHPAEPPWTGITKLLTTFTVCPSIPPDLLWAARRRSLSADSSRCIRWVVLTQSHVRQQLHHDVVSLRA